MNFPENLKYTKDHEWLRLTGNTATIGITDFAQAALGDVVFVELPEVGDEVTAGNEFGNVESTKSQSDLYAPISAKVVAVNGDLADSPELVNSDPYGAGWLIDLELASEDLDQGLEALLDADGYREVVEE